LQDIGLFAVTESQRTEDEHDDEDEDDSKFRNLGLTRRQNEEAKAGAFAYVAGELCCLSLHRSRSL